jgi:hypothetical protein
MKAVRQMDLDEAAEERLRESAEIDRLVKGSMLPLEMEKTRAETQRLMALSSLALSKRTEMADSASQTAILEQFLNEPFDNVVRPRGGSTGGSQSSTGPSFSSGLSSGGGYELDTSGGLFGDNRASVDFDSLPAPDMENLTNPKYAMASASTGISTDQPPMAAENQILEARAADSRDAVRKLDWDSIPNNVPASPQKPKGAATSEQEEDLKKIRSELYPNQNPLESLPNAQNKNEGPGLGNFIADSISDAKYFENQAALFPKRKGGGKAPEALAYEARAYAIRQKLPGEAASRYGIQDPSIINQLYSTKTGVTRSASEIDKIYDTMQKGYVELPDNQGALQRVPVESVEDAIARVEQLRTLMPKQGTSASDPLKNYGDAINTAKGLYEAADKDPDNAERYRKEANAVIKSFVPPQVRQQMYVANQEDIFTGVNPQSWSDGTRNYKGVAISKDMPDEEKVTTAERFNKLAGSAFPAISGKVVGDGLDVGDDAIARTSAWFEQNGLPVPEGNFFAGVTIKTNKGVEAYPVQLNLKTGEIIPMVNLPQPVTTEKATAADPLSSPSDAGLSLRRAVKKGVESVDKAGIAAALGLANIGPGLANISADIYEAGESFSTGKPATKLPRYKLYDGGDVEERYEAQKKRNANKVKAGFDEFSSEEPNNAYDLPNDEYNDVLKFASVYSGEPVKLFKVEGAKEQIDAFTSDKYEKLQAKGLQAVKTSKGVFFVDRSDSQSQADDLENLIKRATNPDTVGDLTNREREILSRWKFERARRGRGLAEGVVETADGLSRLVNDGKELDEFWTGKKAVYEYKGDDFNNPYNFIKAMRSGDKNK